MLERFFQDPEKLGVIGILAGVIWLIMSRRLVPFWFYLEMKEALQAQNRRAVDVARESTVAAKEIVEAAVRKDP